MGNFILCILSALGWLLLAWYCGYTKRDYMHPAVVFACLYAISYPLKLLLSYYGFHILDSMSVDGSIILSSIGISNLAGLAFVTPLLLLPRVTTSPAAFHLDGFSLYVTLLLAALLLISTYGKDAVLALFSQNDLIARIAERGHERTGSGFTALLGQVSTFLMIVFSFKMTGRSMMKNFVPFMLLIILSWLALMLSGSKYKALFLPLVVAISFYYKWRMEGREMLSFHRLIIGLAAALVMVAITGYVRGHGAWTGEADYDPLLQMFHQLSNAFDAPDNLIVLLDRTNSWLTGEMGLVLLRDYLFLPFIPRLLWMGKPLIQGNQLIMMHYFPERFVDHTGEAISPSFPGEMILTGGIFYMVICCLLLGFFLGWLYRKAQLHGGLFFVLYVWCLLNMFNFMRSGTGAVGSFLLFCGVVLFCQTVVNIISFATSSLRVKGVKVTS